MGDSTVRLYVSEVREVYQIEKKAYVRQYEAIIEQPMGKQIQVDWGMTKQKTTEKKEVKLYFIAFVLAHSRFKYMEWQDRPFTTKDTIRCHENAFGYFGGRADEIVYDQDNLIAVSENAGDLILTSEFQAYVRDRQFRVHLCRKADPESNGMIENVVKFIKGNFADSRVYKDNEDWNSRAFQWLERTGNFNVHNNTKKRPAEVFLVEKQHLIPVSPLLSVESNHINSITRNVGKDNTIRFESNRYSLPLGTYGSTKNNQVYLEIIGSYPSTLIIRTSIDGEKIAEHQISKEKGKLIKNRSHSRDRSKGIEEMKQVIITSFKNQEVVSLFIEEVCRRYHRYCKDQMAILINVIKKDADVINEALTICMRERLFSANDFRDVVQYLKKTHTSTDGSDHTYSKSTLSDHKFDVTTRSLSTYTSILGGHVQ